MRETAGIWFYNLRVVLLAFILCAGCSRLPAFSRPRVQTDDGPLSLQAIAYRNLNVEDFRASEPPDELRNHGHQLNAHTAVAIHSLPGADYDFSFQMVDGRQVVCASILNLTFAAAMLPEKSWWNHALQKERFEYVLQHEQVHFALMEVAARQLTRRALREREKLTVCEGDPEAQKDILSATIDRWLAESQKEVLTMHTSFDEATSYLYAPKVQQWWYDRVFKDLQKLTD